MRLSPHLVLLLIALALVGSKCDVRASYGDRAPPPSTEDEEPTGREEASDSGDGFLLVIRVGDSIPSVSAVSKMDAARAASPPAGASAPATAAVPLAGPGSWLAGLLAALLGARHLRRRPPSGGGLH